MSARAASRRAAPSASISRTVSNPFRNLVSSMDPPPGSRIARYRPSVPPRPARQGLSLQEDRDGAVVDEIDRHFRAEAPRRHRNGGDIPQMRHHPVVERLRLLLRCRLVESRPVPLPHVAVEGELGDEQDSSPRLRHGPVHLPLPVLEHPKPEELVAQPPPRRLVIAATDPDEGEQAGADAPDDLAADGDRRARHPLYHRPHLSPSGLNPMAPSRSSVAERRRSPPPPPPRRCRPSSGRARGDGDNGKTLLKIPVDPSDNENRDHVAAVNTARPNGRAFPERSIP